MRRSAVIAAAATALLLGGASFVGDGCGCTTPGAQPTSGGAGDTANLWVDTSTSGNTCVDHGSLTEYATNDACDSFDEAWDAAEAGDLIRVKAGTYEEQVVDGDKASEARIVGDGDGDDVIVGDGGEGADCPDPHATGSAFGALCLDANHVTVENVTTVVNDPGPYGGLRITGDDVTVRNFHTHGGSHADGPRASSIGIQGLRFFFDGGSIGRTDTVEVATCDHSAMEPIWFQSAGDDAVIDGVDIGRYDALTRAGPNCGELDNTPHIESIRFEDSDNITIRNSTFHGPTDAGSGHIFYSADPDNITLVNNVFEHRGLGNAWMQVNGGTLGSGWVWAYNTFLDDGGHSGGPDTEVFVGNFGYSPGCGTTDILNVYEGSGSCGTSTYIGAADFGLDADNKLEAGSPAIDAAETPGASDYCTGSDVDSVDFEGTVRPQGSVCDAGADER